MTNKQHCVRCVISGRVQGVGFRYATLEKALALGLTGRVRNLPDRRVEVVACGEERAVTALCNWLLWQGPTMARVSEVRCESIAARAFTDFAID